MAVQMLRQFNGLEAGAVVTLDSGEESRLIALGLARDWTPARDGASGSSMVGVLRADGSYAATMPDGAAYALTEQAPIQTVTATGTALTGPGEYGGFRVRALNGTPQLVTVYDATSATGVPIHEESVSAVGYFPWAGNKLRPLTTGCHVVISGGTSRTIDVIVGA